MRLYRRSFFARALEDLVGHGVIRSSRGFGSCIYVFCWMFAGCLSLGFSTLAAVYVSVLVVVSGFVFGFGSCFYFRREGRGNGR